MHFSQSKYYLFRLLGVTLFSILVLCNARARAEMMNFEEEYRYEAGEADSKLSCRAISLLQVKLLLLERLGTYIESTTQVVNMQLSRDEVTSLSAGIVKTEILEESWDGKTYSLTARIQADPNEVIKLLDRITDSGKKNEQIARIDQVNQDGLERIKQLKSQMEEIQGDLVAVNRDYEQASRIVAAWGAAELGQEQMRNGEWAAAAASFTKVLEIKPNIDNFLQRAVAFRKLNKFTLALADLDRVIKMNPKVSEAYFQRGQILKDSGDIQEGISEIRKAAGMGNGKAELWLKAKGKW
ncbi:MAG: tetratricopeptide repeat protein [Desulfobulbaceae bacterium]|nr:tetratricopeptide repeat protein [Desulfobulbaceae bacterium]